MAPTIDRIVHYRSKTGRYTVPAMVSATVDTLYRPAVDGGHIPDLSSPTHAHLTVFTPGTPGERLPGTEPSITATNAGGTYQEWDVPYDVHFAETHADCADDDTRTPGTWAWPRRT